MADRRQEDVAARLVGLRLDREPDVVAVVHGVLREEVEPLPVAFQRRPDVLRGVHLGTFTTAPEDVRACSQLRREVEVAHHLAQRVPTRSEEHTSELQSRQYLVCRLLLEKKK